ncbi:hypothetical protein BC829DRAFT_276690 [Chytridium lagenaria]|nr:hypothetical protein BC829DRAFT_276690 [Chytridium lagenaria]
MDWIKCKVFWKGYFEVVNFLEMGFPGSLFFFFSVLAVAWFRVYSLFLLSENSFCFCIWLVRLFYFFLLFLWRFVFIRYHFCILTHGVFFIIVPLVSFVFLLDNDFIYSSVLLLLLFFNKSGI